jgi:hypothetical protein
MPIVIAIALGGCPEEPLPPPMPVVPAVVPRAAEPPATAAPVATALPSTAEAPAPAPAPTSRPRTLRPGLETNSGLTPEEAREKMMQKGPVPR